MGRPSIYKTDAERQEAARRKARDRKSRQRAAAAAASVEIGEPFASLLKAHAEDSKKTQKEIVQEALGIYFRRRKLL